MSSLLIIHSSFLTDSQLGSHACMTFDVITYFGLTLEDTHGSA